MEAPSSSNFTRFRQAAVLTCFVLALTSLMHMWHFGAAALPHLHQPLVEAVLGLAGSRGSGPDELLFGAVLVLYALSFGLFAMSLNALTVQGPARGHAAWLAAQVGLALFVDGRLLFLTAATFALLLPRRSALVWLIAQMGVGTAMQIWRSFHESGPDLLCVVDASGIPSLSATQRLIQACTDTALHLACQAIAFGIGYLGGAEQRRRIQLAAAHAHLLATEQMLSDTAAAAERTRVARELHDAIGHQLMALTLHLDLAVRRSGDSPVPPSVKAAHAVTQALLATVRSVVRHERRLDDGTRSAASAAKGAP